MPHAPPLPRRTPAPSASRHGTSGCSSQPRLSPASGVRSQLRLYPDWLQQSAETVSCCFPPPRRSTTIHTAELPYQPQPQLPGSLTLSASPACPNSRSLNGIMPAIIVAEDGEWGAAKSKGVLHKEGQSCDGPIMPAIIVAEDGDGKNSSRQCILLRQTSQPRRGSGEGKTEARRTMSKAMSPDLNNAAMPLKRPSTATLQKQIGTSDPTTPEKVAQMVP